MNSKNTLVPAEAGWNTGLTMSAPLSRRVLHKGAASPSSMFDVLAEEITSYLDGYTGNGHEDFDEFLETVTSWTVEQVHAEGAVQQMDKLDAVILYRLNIRETCTMLLDKAGVQRPWNLSCAGWDSVEWHIFQQGEEHNGRRYTQIFGIICDAALFSPPQKHQGEEWSPWPEYYLTAALYLSDLPLEAVQQKVNLMESLVADVITQAAASIKNDPVV
jgi:hypothetical protein